MEELYPKGSEWRKWDLHVHTPASYDWDRKCGKTVEEIVETAIAKGLFAIAITDHHSMAAVQEGIDHGKKKGLFVIPGVELRTNMGNNKIHIIALFSPDIAPKTIHEKVLCPIGFSEEDIKKSGDEQVYCDFKHACGLVHELGGLVFLHAGGKANGIEQLSSDMKRLLKTDLARMVDIFEVNSKKSVKDYRDIVFPIIKQEFPCLITSDSTDRSKLTYKSGHSIEVIGKAYSWIKADTTFCGLRQILAEPVGRVYLGNTPPKLTDIAAHPSRYIDSLEVGPIASGGGSWFDNKIALSSELTAVIGKKGSGKSAFVDIVALSGKSSIDPEHYSFLHKTKFRKDHITARKYRAVLKWKDGETVEVQLDEDVIRASEPERVKYLPQKFVEEICNDYGVSLLFQDEIDKVIFSYVPEEKRLSTTNLRDFIQKRADAINSAVARTREGITKKNIDIFVLEEKQRPEYRRKIENKLTAKQKEHDSVKNPAPVAEPKNKLPKGQADKLAKIEEELIKVGVAIQSAKEERKTNADSLSFLDKLDGKINLLTDDVEKIYEFDKEADSAGLNLRKLIKLEVDSKTLTAKRRELKVVESNLNKKLDELDTDSKVSLYIKQKKLEAEKKAISDSFTEQHKKYEEYKKLKKAAEEARKAIIGHKNDTSLNTIISLTNELNYISTMLDDALEVEYRERTRLSRALVKAVLGKIDLFKEIYQPLIDFIKQEKAKQEATGNMLTFDAGVVFDKSAFIEGFLKQIDQSRDGSFQGKALGLKNLKAILDKYTLEDADQVVKLTEEVLNCLVNDTTKTTPTKNDLVKQLKQSSTAEALYDFLYKVEYMDVRFKIRFNEKDLNENVFSPGEKGALLLIFYLLIDKEKIPLIMDQPEENLDNETVYTLLVPYIKRAKESRQIIIVTHNPNLAVVCDAEQVISATMVKAKNEIRYRAGSIEDLATNRKIVDTLEGTMPAFTKRDQKYIR